MLPICRGSIKYLWLGCNCKVTERMSDCTGLKNASSRNAVTMDVGYVRISKIAWYETPYNVTGIVKHTGSEGKPKNIYEQIELSERGNVRTWSDYTQRSVNEEIT